MREASANTAIASPPSFLISFAVSPAVGVPSRLCSLRLLTTTRAPSFASSCAIARPMLCPEPVTMATLPLKRSVMAPQLMASSRALFHREKRSKPQRTITGYCGDSEKGKNMTTIRLSIAACALASAALLAGPATAQAPAAFPSKNVLLVVPQQAGGPTDVLVRLFQPRLAALLGQSVVVDNKVGAAGYIALDFVANAPPDG